MFIEEATDRSLKGIISYHLYVVNVGETSEEDVIKLFTAVSYEFS
jgi:hypothetical protein